MESMRWTTNASCGIVESTKGYEVSRSRFIRLLQNHCITRNDTERVLDPHLALIETLSTRQRNDKYQMGFLIRKPSAFEVSIAQTLTTKSDNGAKPNRAVNTTPRSTEDADRRLILK